MTKEHKKLYKAGKKWCVMGITTLAVAIGALTVTGINNAEAAVESQPTTQLAQAQTTVTNLQRQYDNQSRQLNLASQAVTLAQNNLKSAQGKAQSADGTLAAANRDVSQAQQAKQTAEKEQADAASRVQTEQDVISRENTNIRNGKQALSDAQNEQLAAQSDVDNKANAAKQAEQVAKQQQDINDQKQAAVNATDSKISQVKDQINSVNKISVSANYINAVKDNTSFTGNDLQVLNKNSYHHSQQDAQRSFDDLNNLSQNDWAELGTFAVGLLNGIRQVAGQAPLMVTDGSVKFGQDIANIYLKHQYIDQGNREASKVNAADQNGLYNFYKYYTLTGTLNRQVLNYSQSSISLGNYTRTVTSYAFTPVTMDSLKQDTYNMILDGLRDIQKARELLMSGKYAAVTGMDQQLDLLMIDDGDLDTNGGTVFGKKSYTIPTVDTAKLQGQLTELQKLKSKQSAALTVAAQALKTAQDKFAQANNVLKKAKEQLVTSKQEVATKQQDLTAAKNRLKVAQNALVAAQKIANGQAVKNAESRLAQVKEKQQVAQENQQVAHEQVNKLKAELKTANDKYTKLKEDRSLTHQKLLNAQEQLKRLQTGTINYIDPDGKVVKADQVSGKVGNKVDVKLSLPDGYELANKDEQVPSTITVGNDGIKT
ncbi:SEC10/PgrA surface exclusion domain-containing protein, partial [Limosilactobacillus sp. Sa3CUN2]